MANLLQAIYDNDFNLFHSLLFTYGIPAYPTDYHLLAKALLYGRTSMARLLVDYGCNLNLPNFKGNSPLHLAVHNDDCPEFIEQMVIRGALVSALDPRGDTALHVAFDNDVDERIVDLLLIGLAQQSSCNEANEAGFTFLHIAATRPEVLFVRYLIGHCNAEVNCQVNIDADSLYAGNTPLHMAVEFGRLEVAKSLLNYGADLYAKDVNGSTPLHLALEHRDERMIELLFAYDFDRVNHVNRFGLSHFMAACACNNSNVVRDFLQDLANGNYNLNVNEIVNSPHHYSFKDYTPLLIAVEYGHIETVRLLLANGACPLLKNQELESIAIKNNYYDIARLIELYTLYYEGVDRVANNFGPCRTVGPIPHDY